MGKGKYKRMNIFLLKAGTTTHICFLSCEWKIKQWQDTFFVWSWSALRSCNWLPSKCMFALPSPCLHLIFLCVILHLTPWMDSVQRAFQQPFTKTIQVWEPDSLDGASLIFLKLSEMLGWVRRDELCNSRWLICFVHQVHWSYFWELESSIGLTWNEISFKNNKINKNVCVSGGFLWAALLLV